MRRLRWPVYPFLISIHPILSLLAANLGQTRMSDSLRALAAALLIGGLTMLSLRALTGDRDRGAFLTALLSLAFFSYGHVYSAARSIADPEFILARHRALLPVYAVLLLAGLLWSKRSGKWAQINMASNLIGLALIAIPIAQIGLFQAELASAAIDENSLELNRRDLPAAEQPDVYLIILDAYTRADVLRDRFGVNNQPFLAQLDQMGFQVFECSQSNYGQTELTLAAALNAAYLEELRVEIYPGKRSRTELLFLIRHNRLRSAFERAGYRVYAFETGYPWSEWQSVDVYLQPGGSGGLRLNGFEVLLLDGTAMRAAADARAALPESLGAWREDPLRSHRERIEYALGVLPDLAGEPGPKLVFAHLVIPHRPYLFAPPDGWAADHGYLDPGGEPEGLGGYEIGYRNQVLYLNYILPEVLREIEDRTERPVIILLMGDHGADEAPPAERMAILHALRLPGETGMALEDDMTPVNSVRLLLNEALGADLPLLQDRSLYSTYDRPFDFQAIEHPCDA